MKKLLVSVIALFGAVSLSAQDVTAIYNEAAAAFGAKNFTEAAAKFEQVIDQGMDNESAASMVATAKSTLPKCYFMLGGGALKTKNYDEALKNFEKSAELAELYGDMNQMAKSNGWVAKIYQIQGGDAFNNKDYATASEIFAKGYAAESGTTFKQVNTMAEAFEGADIVIPKSWAPFAAMEKRTNLYAEGDDAGIAALEKELLAQNATHQDWCSTTELMENTANGQDTIFMHPLPADISGVSCEHGEVNADVFDMHRVGMYKEASYKPYAIAAMMFLQKVADPAATLKALDERNTARWLQA